jgi:hypothetical protein
MATTEHYRGIDAADSSDSTPATEPATFSRSGPVAARSGAGILRFAPPISVAVGAGFVLWGVAIGLLRLHDNSFLTHVATGRLMLDSGIPHADPYSFTAHGHSWILESWFAELLYGAVDRAGPAHGLQLLHVAAAGVLAALVWILTRPAGALLGRVLVAGAALSVGTGYWSPRPLLLALVLFAVVILMCENDRWSPWLLVPVMWLWVNVHGSWPFALAYLLLRLLGRAVERRPLGRQPRLLAAGAIGTLLGAANPYGFRLLTYPLIVATHHQAFSHIMEWQSPSFSDLTNVIFLAEVLLALLLLVARRGTVEDALVALAFTATALYASRNVPVASLVVVPVLARGMAGLGTIRGDRRSFASLATVALVAILGVVVVASSLRHPEFQLSAYPVKEVSWMEGRGLVPGRVATQDFVGNYLEYRYGERASAFIDDRVDMYPPAVEQAYGVLLKGSLGWQRELDRYRINTVLWSRSEPLAALIEESPHWRTVLADQNWIVAVRAPVVSGTAAS